MAAEHAEGSQDLGQVILHHVANGPPLVEIKVPIGARTLDLSITKHVVVMWVVSVLVFLLYTWLGRQMKRSEDGAPKGAFASMLEFFVSFVREQMVLPFIGHKYARTFTPLILTFFTFIFFSNLFGLTPVIELTARILGWDALSEGSSTPTGNFNVTAGLACITFSAIIFAGSMAHGVIGHWKNLVPHGLPILVYPLLIPIEIISMFVKPFALTMRLAANMTAGHVAILAVMSFVFVFKSVLIGLFVSLPLMVGLMMLEIIVCLVQAYVFSLLSSLFIGMAIHVHH